MIATQFHRFTREQRAVVRQHYVLEPVPSCHGALVKIPRLSSPVGSEERLLPLQTISRWLAISSKRIFNSLFVSLFSESLELDPDVGNYETLFGVVVHCFLFYSYVCRLRIADLCGHHLCGVQYCYFTKLVKLINKAIFSIV